MLKNARFLASAALAALMAIKVPPAFTLPDFAPRSKSLKITTGHRYPHSSDRQRSRYARQIEAGQIKMERV